MRGVWQVLVLLSVCSVAQAAVSCATVQTCNSTSECDVGGCFEGDCVSWVNLDVGTECGDFGTCAWGAYCDPDTDRCVSQGEEGDNCGHSRECVPPLVCGGSECIYPKYPGDTCEDNWECVLGGGCADLGVCEGAEYDEVCCVGANCTAEMPCSEGYYCFASALNTNGVCRAQIGVGDECDADAPDVRAMCAGMSECNTLESTGSTGTCVSFGSLPSLAVTSASSSYSCADNTVVKYDENDDVYRCVALNVNGATNCENADKADDAHDSRLCGRYGTCACSENSLTWKCEMNVTRSVTCGGRAAAYRYCMDVNNCHIDTYATPSTKGQCHYACNEELTLWNCCLLREGEAIVKNFRDIECVVGEKKKSGGVVVAPSVGVWVGVSAVVAVVVAGGTV